MSDRGPRLGKSRARAQGMETRRAYEGKGQLAAPDESPLHAGSMHSISDKFALRAVATLRWTKLDSVGRPTIVLNRSLLEQLG